ncbi:TetR/AcrR family transcriptional regulator [Streptomyces sp. AC536]|uniref:TetR/AcrR family transcriptional regulator n=1 Tax=Streptomyces buecherae TaxID=2763006 RepID=UPI00164DD355|nr:TetR/AcrR family transcriptional regulator [Streptomyces buecherae]MBC3982249.1 TetR/AcrR family transcriptional regulator [Streptomyces buecherae]QNJ41838.1 TetR/AcrR family transcriptional regulator [Streptomyces buecherae]
MNAQPAEPTRAAPARSTPDPVVSPSALRREPRQRRSREKVDRIMDAAVGLVVREGYAAATTTRIAEAAGVGLATLYGFFTDRRAVFRAASARNLDAFLGRLDQLLARAGFTHWSEAATAGFDEYVRMSRADVGFRMVLFGDVADDRLLAEGRRNDEVVADRLAELIGTRFGVVVDDRLRTALLTAVAAGDALVKLAFECDPEQGDPAVLAEARRVVQGIFERGGPREYGAPAARPAPPADQAAPAAPAASALAGPAPATATPAAATPADQAASALAAPPVAPPPARQADPASSTAVALPGAREGETGSGSEGSAPAERGAGGGPAVA